METQLDTPQEGMEPTAMASQNRSQEIAKLAAALCAAQGAMQNASMNKVNSYFNSRYATLGAIRDAVREPLFNNGLCVTQTTKINENGNIILNTVLLHISGEWVSSEFPILFTGKPQEMGSALTYAKRYQLSAIVGIAADEDDDANAAEEKQPKVLAPKTPAPDPISSGKPAKNDPPPQTKDAIEKIMANVNFSAELLPVPLLKDESGSDWMAWGQGFMGLARTAPDAEGLALLEKNNAMPMKNMEMNAPKMFTNMILALLKVRKELEKKNA